QAAPHDVVIILAPGVARNPAAILAGEARGVRPRGLIELADADHVARSGQEISRIVADGGAAIGEIAHSTGLAFGDPVPVTGSIFSGQRGGHARELKSAVARQFADVVRGQISSPTWRISSMALLLRTMP